MSKHAHESQTSRAPPLDVPEGWVSAALIGTCELNPAKPPSNSLSPDAPVTFVSMAAVDAESGSVKNPQIRPFAEVRNGHPSFKEGDVIMAKITPCMENGKAAIVQSLANGIGFGSTEFHVFRPTAAILAEYVYHFIRQESFREAAADEMTGSVGQKRVPADFLKRVSLPLPPLAEQQRIVAKIEALLARVNAARQRLAKVPAILKRFRQSVLAAACSGRLTEDWREHERELEPAINLFKAIQPKGKVTFREVDDTDLPAIPLSWAWVYLPNLGYLNRGKSRHRPRNATHLYGGPYPFIQTGDIAQSGGRITCHKQTYSEEGLAQSRLWPAGTICITIAANIADSAILTYAACFPDSVVGLIPDPECCVTEFVEFFIRTARDDLSQFAPATAQKNINIAILNDVAVPLPPLAEQREIVRRVEALFHLADGIEKRVAAATLRAEKLTQAILAKAFRGELVPTEAELARQEGRDYEPASVLLERIRGERGTVEKGKRSRAPGL